MAFRLRLGTLATIAALMMGAAIVASCEMPEEVPGVSEGTPTAEVPAQTPASNGANAQGTATVPAGPVGQSPPPWTGPIPTVNAFAPPADLPLEMAIPKLQVAAPMMEVGITRRGEMEAPSAPSGDPVWGKVFWYRGSSPLGASGTATVAGHFTDMIGKPAVFARLDDLAPGDQIIIRDATGQSMTFSITEKAVYDLQQIQDPLILSKIYGPGPVSGQGPLPSPDGKAIMSLVTCVGEFRDGQFTHRLVVYAERVPG